VPVLLLTGPTGVEKSAALAAASSLLTDAGVPHATVTLADVARLGPAPAEDESNERVGHAISRRSGRTTRMRERSGCCSNACSRHAHS
jgi:hypothetical protein